MGESKGNSKRRRARRRGGLGPDDGGGMGRTRGKMTVVDFAAAEVAGVVADECTATQTLLQRRRYDCWKAGIANAD